MVDFTKELCSQVDQICDSFENDPTHLLPILQEAQELTGYNYVTEEMAGHIARRLDVTIAHVSSVMSFFANISSQPRGKNVIQICRSTACMVNDYQNVRDILEQELNIKVGNTTDDKIFSLEYTECIGACDISPAIRVNKNVYGNLTENKIKDLLSEYRRG